MWNELGNTLKPSARIPEKPFEMDFLNRLEVPNRGKTEWLHSYWAQWTFLPFYDTVRGGCCTQVPWDFTRTVLWGWGVRADWQHPFQSPLLFPPSLILPSPTLSLDPFWTSVCIPHYASLCRPVCQDHPIVTAWCLCLLPLVHKHKCTTKQMHT